MNTDPILNPPALVQAAVDLAQAGAEIDGLLAQIRRGDAACELAGKIVTSWRYRAGVLFAQVRKAFPARGPKAKGWGEFVAARGISLDSAARYIEVAEQVGMQPELAQSGSFMDLYRVLDLAKDFPQSAVNVAVQQKSLDPQEERRRALNSSNSEVWLTPPEVCDPLVVFAGDDGVRLDPCAHPLSIIPAAVHWCGPPHADGLTMEWPADGPIYVNPPYGDALKPWSAKIAAEAARGAEIIALVPVASGTAWWDALDKGSRGWCALSGRLHFLEPVPDWQAREQRRAERTGKPVRPVPAEEFPGLVRTESALFDSALIYFGPRWARFCEVFGGLGRIYTSGAPAPAPAPAPEKKICANDAEGCMDFAEAGSDFCSAHEPAPASYAPLLGGKEGEALKGKPLQHRLFPEPHADEEDDDEEETPPAAEEAEERGRIPPKAEKPVSLEERQAMLRTLVRVAFAQAHPAHRPDMAPVLVELAEEQVPGTVPTASDGEMVALATSAPRLMRERDTALARVAELEAGAAAAGRRGYETGAEETLAWVAGLLGWPPGEDSTPGRDDIEEAITKQGARVAELQEELDATTARAKARLGRAEEELRQARAKIAELETAPHDTVNDREMYQEGEHEALVTVAAYLACEPEMDDIAEAIEALKGAAPRAHQAEESDAELALGDQVLWTRQRSKGRTDPPLRGVVVCLAPLHVWIRPRLEAKSGEARRGFWESQIIDEELSPDPQAEAPAMAIQAAIDALAERREMPTWQEDLRLELRRAERRVLPPSAQLALPAAAPTEPPAQDPPAPPARRPGDVVLIRGGHPATVIGEEAGKVVLYRKLSAKRTEVTYLDAGEDLALAEEQDRAAALRIALADKKTAGWRKGLMEALRGLEKGGQA